MGKKVVKVDPKYVDMLNKAYEKYSKLEVVNSNFEHFSDSFEDENKLLIEKNDSTKNTPKIKFKPQIKSKKFNAIENLYSFEHFTKSSEAKKKLLEVNKSSSDSQRKEIKCQGKSKIIEKTKKIKNYANYGHKSYSEEENNFLLKYLEDNKDNFGLNKTSRELEKLMKGRTHGSIKHQVKALRSGQTATVVAKTRKVFSLTEDKLIIDEAIKHLKICKSLRDAIIQNPLEFSKNMKRSDKSIFDRWESFIKCWLLQYYNKNLNREIRPMLSDFVHMNFESVLEIDWEFVLSHKEFSGYNVKGLKKIFFLLTADVAKYLSKPSYELSLKDIANYTNENILNKKRRAEPTRDKRKMDCIQYFEQRIKEQNISCSKT